MLDDLSKELSSRLQHIVNNNNRLIPLTGKSKKSSQIKPSDEMSAYVYHELHCHVTPLHICAEESTQDSAGV